MTDDNKNLELDTEDEDDDLDFLGSSGGGGFGDGNEAEDSFEIDLGEVDEDRAYPVLAPGTYPGRVDEVSYGRSQRSNNRMVTWRYKVQGPDGQEVTVWNHTVLTPEGMPRFKKACARTNPAAPAKFRIPEDLETLFLGYDVMLRLKIENSKEYGRRNRVVDILPAGSEAGRGASDFLKV